MNNSALLSTGSHTCYKTVSRIEILEAKAGPARREYLCTRLREVAGGRGQTWIVSCNFDLGGPWAGVNELFSGLVNEMLSRRPDLARRHAVELTYVLPSLRKALSPAYASLTDTAPPEERLRNYAADRAFRLVHGLIDLLDSWKRVVAPHTAWCIGCEDYHRAGAIARHFFRELMRRRGQLLNIHLIAAVDPGHGPEVAQWFDSATRPKLVSLSLESEQTPATLTAEGASQLASEIEKRIGNGPDAAEAHLADLLRLWTLANRDDKILHWKCFAADVYLRRGLYEDAGRYTRGLLRLADTWAPNQSRRLWIINKTLNTHMGAQDHREGLKFVEEVVLPILEKPTSREHVDLFFSAAMMYARYKKPRDFAKGEEFLDRGIAALEHLDVPVEEYHFLYVLNRNGVAMIRSFEGRFQEALDLCRAGLNRLNQHLRSDKHRPQRSLLVYNIAQVYLAMGYHAEALEHYTAVIGVDPEYSEYYNERGNILLRLGRFEQAAADYLKAIQLSPPYDEVQTNLGQCYRRMGKFSKAVACYTRALDLRADQMLALVGRAKSYEELGMREQAHADYSAALVRDPSQWEVLANRGVLSYEAGNLAESLADFNRAIELAPDQRDLHKNRSIVLSDLGRHAEAARDIQSAFPPSA